MRLRVVFVSTVLVLLSTTVANAKSEFLEEFKERYATIGQDLLKTATEIGKVKNFVYKKDVATFTFDEGTFYLLSNVDGRPTTAAFVGHGRANIQIPSELERRSLMAVSGKDAVNEEFTTCLIRMADDFDLALREATTLEKSTLGWRSYNSIKQNQGEYYFKPLIYHHYDNYFQLTRSTYERREDGFFWIDFNRYVYTFDPNRPEQVIVSYEYEGGDEVITESAIFQREENALYDNSQMSEILYETAIIDKSGSLEAGGSDGSVIKAAAVTMNLVVLSDSLRFVTTFLDDGFRLDSLHFEGEPVDYHQRGSFSAVEVMLPDYRHRGDTLSLTYFYRGKHYLIPFPYVDNPKPGTHSYSFSHPESYNYFMPGHGSTEKAGKRMEKFAVTPPNPYRYFLFRGYAAGLDTIPVVSEIGITLNFLKSSMLSKKISDCFIPQEMYQRDITEAFNFMSQRFGSPQGSFEIFVSPHGSKSMPGLLEIPQIICVTEGEAAADGGFKAVAGKYAARQWFGSLMRPATNRETWIVDALPEFVNLLYLENTLGGTYYTNLMGRRDSILLSADMIRSTPLATGDRCRKTIRANKGLWIFHMIRNMMRDLETSSDRKFLKYLRDVMARYNQSTFTNNDFIALTEKHYGKSLTAFFDYWLYGGDIPSFAVNYKIQQKDDGFYIDAAVSTEGVGDSFAMPVMLNVIDGEGELSFHRRSLTGSESSFQIGPFPEKPARMEFNEFYSILADKTVTKK